KHEPESNLSGAEEPASVGRWDVCRAGAADGGGMLSDAQRKLHWSGSRNSRGDCGWGMVARVNEWRDPIPEELLDRQVAKSQWHYDVVNIAEGLGRLRDGALPASGGRRVTAEDLRHAAYV